MKEQKLQKICNIIRQTTLRSTLLKAEELPKRIKINEKPKRAAFEMYNYVQDYTEQLEPQQEKYEGLFDSAKEDITKKINEYLMEEEMGRLQMELFMVNHSIAVEQNRIQELKGTINSKQNNMNLQVNALKKNEKNYRRPIISGRSSRRDRSSPRSPICSELVTKRLRICSSQNVTIQPQAKLTSEALRIVQEEQLARTVEVETEHIPAVDQRSKIDYNKLTKIAQIDRTIQLCEKKLKNNKKFNRKHQKKQCMEIINNLWKEIHAQMM